MIAWRGALLALLFLVRYRHQISLHASQIWLRSRFAWTNRPSLFRSGLGPVVREPVRLPGINALRPRLTPVRL